MWLKVKEIIYLFFISIVFSLMSIGCANNMDAKNLTQTGVFDQNGNLITNTLVYTNRANFKGNIPIWATNLKANFVIRIIKLYTKLIIMFQIYQRVPRIIINFMFLGQEVGQILSL